MSCGSGLGEPSRAPRGGADEHVPDTDGGRRDGRVRSPRRHPACQTGQAAIASRLSFLSVSAAPGFACAVAATGTPFCWGQNNGDVAVPESSRYRQISAGSRYACGLRRSGLAVCWGGGDDRLHPARLAFKAIATSRDFACGLTHAGRLECWGDKATVRLGDDRAPSGTFIQLSAGEAMACGIRPSGAPSCWGGREKSLVKPPEGTLTQVSVGSRTACGLQSGGRPVCWRAGMASPRGRVQVRLGRRPGCMRYPRQRYSRLLGA